MSLSTRLLSTYLEGIEGREYLKAHVVQLISNILAVDHSLEVNPKYIADKNIDIKRNLEKICEISQEFLDSVLSTANQYPTYALYLFYYCHSTNLDDNDDDDD